MQYLKYLNYLLPVFVAYIFLSIALRNYKNGRIEKQIRSNPVYVNATITEIVPDTPSKLGVVSITLDYEFNAENGMKYQNKHARTVVKTMDLYNYKVGTTVPVVYLKTDPALNILNVQNEMLK
ncbi:DUF3592 domain-containing protein [Kosakonia sp. BK9b]|uniref:hypothetical protein n=1 Tax=Kosakonia sp. TaxID=1916651 RepID=UPI00289BC7EC|nr:hypothetical protein [Kosakonia sp.]